MRPLNAEWRSRLGRRARHSREQLALLCVWLDGSRQRARAEHDDWWAWFREKGEGENLSVLVMGEDDIPFKFLDKTVYLVKIGQTALGLEKKSDDFHN